MLLLRETKLLSKQVTRAAARDETVIQTGNGLSRVGGNAGRLGGPGPGLARGLARPAPNTRGPQYPGPGCLGVPSKVSPGGGGGLTGEPGRAGPRAGQWRSGSGGRQPSEQAVPGGPAGPGRHNPQPGARAGPGSAPPGGPGPVRAGSGLGPGPGRTEPGLVPGPARARTRAGTGRPAPRGYRYPESGWVGVFRGRGVGAVARLE